MPSMKPHPRLPRQRGAATLIVVMVIFFVISLVAAYTSRNMIFEQRTSSNQYRSTQALEAAEAGLEWALTQLNFGRITTSCGASTNTGDTSFRQRYLDINATTGTIVPRLTAGGAALTSPQCVFDPAGGNWSCSCPVDDTASTLAPPSGTATAPAFRVRFVPLAGALPPSQPGVIRAEVVGCTRLDATCLDFAGQGQMNEGRAVVSSLVALTGNAASTPTAGLTARGSVTVAATVYNTTPTGSGITVQAGGPIDSMVVARTIAGTPGSASLVPNDPALSLPAAGPYSPGDRMFAAVFNMFPNTFRQQQGGLQKACGVGGCAASDVRTLIGLNPGRPLWLDGSLVIDSSGDIGSAAEPVLLVVNGDVVFATSGVTIHGLVYVRPAAPATGWAVINSGQVTGAVVSEGNITGGSGATPTIVHSSEALNRLRGGTGTFVRVASSWRDYQ